MKYREYKEIKVHGSSDFQFEYYYVDKNHPHYEMPLHWHTNFEVIRVNSGRLRLYLDNVEYILSDGDVAYVGCGSMHRAEPENCVYECAVFDLAILSGYGSTRILEYLGPIVSRNAEVDAICASANPYVKRLFEISAAEEEYYELEVASTLAAMICELYRAGAVNSSPR